MTSGPKRTLLEDLASLLRKHGPEAFDELARQLAAPGFREELVQLLGTLARASGTLPPHIESLPGRSRHSEGDGMSGEDEHVRKRLLEAVRARLNDRQKFPGVADLREFAEKVGFRPKQKASRAQLVGALCRELARRDTAELNELLQLLTAPEASSLRQWSDLIILEDERS